MNIPPPALASGFLANRAVYAPIPTNPSVLVSLEVLGGVTLGRTPSRVMPENCPTRSLLGADPGGARRV